jgi:hypothetical protein
MINIPVSHLKASGKYNLVLVMQISFGVWRGWEELYGYF